MSRTFPPRSPSDTRDPWSDFESEELEGSAVDADPREHFSSESPELPVSRRGGDTQTVRYEIPLDGVARPAPPASRRVASRRSTHRGIGALAALCVAGIGALVMWPRASDIWTTAVPTPPLPRVEFQNAAPPAAVSPLVSAPAQGSRRAVPPESGTSTLPPAAAAAARLLPTDTASRPAASQAGSPPLDSPGRTDDSPAELTAAAQPGDSAAAAPSPTSASAQPAAVEPAAAEPPFEPVVPPAPARAEPDPPAVVPPAVVEAAAPPPVVPPRIDEGREGDEEGIQQVLQRYQLAYEQLDAAAAQEVWPGVDVRGLSRAFDNLRSQELAFDRCELNVTGEAAEAICRGVGTYVPKVGGQAPRRVQGEWAFQLERIEGTWTIAQIETR